MADGEAEAGSTVYPRAAAVDLAELLEDQSQRGLGDADAGIRHSELHPLPDGAHVERDRAHFCELGGVAQEVDEDLLELLLIGAERRR